MWCKALRTFDARGEHFERGDAVNTEGWPVNNVDAMCSTGWLIQMSQTERLTMEKLRESAPSDPMDLSTKRGPGRPRKEDTVNA